MKANTTIMHVNLKSSEEKNFILLKEDKVALNS